MTRAQIADQKNPPKPKQGKKVVEQPPVEKKQEPPTITEKTETELPKIKLFEFDDSKKQYPETISQLLQICLLEEKDVKQQLKGHVRQNYIKIFNNYKENLNEKDMYIINSGLNYIYTHSRVKSISEDMVEKLIKIYEIPISHIISYTNKKDLVTIAKNHGLSYSNKKLFDLIKNIRGVVDPM
jgi:hypothetical protein